MLSDGQTDRQKDIETLDILKGPGSEPDNSPLALLSIL